MLRKFITIKNVGKFRNYGAAGDIEFRKLSLIYAENGRGKTTLCAILRSLQTGDPLFITERRTVNGTADPLIDVLTAGGKLTFNGTVWSSTLNNVVVFDSTYVSENVYSGDFIEHEHKKRLHNVTVGKQGVELAQKVSVLDVKSRDLASKLQESAKALTKKLPTGLTLDQFLALPKDDAIDAKVAEKKSSIVALTDAEAIKTKTGFIKLICPVLPTTLAETLGRTLEDMSKDVEAMIRKHIAAHGMGTSGEAWVAQGLPYVKNESCPFCGQNVSGNDLIQNYGAYFGNAYRHLKTEIVALESIFANAFSEKNAAALQTAIIKNQANAEFWKKYTSIALPELDFENGIKPVLGTLTAIIAPLIQRKLSAPLEPITTPPETTKATESLETLRNNLGAYNRAVDAANAAIDAVKRAVATGNMVALRKELAQLETQKARHSDELADACQSHQNLHLEKTTTEEQKDVAKKQLDEYTEQILRQYEGSINKLLERFGAGFRITGTKQQYLGGSPSSTFKLEILGVSIDLGDSKTPRGTPCFRSIMSSGDRNTLALAFFLVQLGQRTDIADLTVVFDDPLTSLDRFRQQFTRDQIHAVTKKAKQVIVLSHEPAFLQLVADGYDNGELRLLCLSRDGMTDTTIKPWDMTIELAPGYAKDVAALSAYYLGDAVDLRAVVRCVRPVMEGYLRSTYYGSFPEKKWLGDMIVLIRDAAAGSPLDSAKPMLQDIESLNDFTKRYHHDNNEPKQVAEPIQDTELHAYVRLTLKLINRI